MGENVASEMGKTPWRKAPEALTAAFAEAARPLPGVQTRKMFGYPCAFFNGHLFAGVHADTLIFRLGPQDRDAFLALPGASLFEPMAGRPMREYVQAPEAMVGSPAEWTPWLDKALAYAALLPPKAAKAAKPEKPARKKSSVA